MTGSAEVSVCQCRMDMNEVERCEGRGSSKAADRGRAAEHLAQMADGKAWLPGPDSAERSGVNQTRPGSSEPAFWRPETADLRIWGRRWVPDEA